MKFNQYMQKKGPAKAINENASYAINEAEGGIMQFFKDMKSYAVIMSQYPKLYKEKKDAEVEQAVALAKFDVQGDERAAQMEEKAKEQMDAKIEALPREKRAAARQQMEQKMAVTKEKIKEQIKVKRTALDNQLKAKVSEIDSDINELESKNTVESEYMSKSIEKMKTETQLDMDEKAEEERVAKVYSIKDISDEQMEKQRQKAKEDAAKERQEKEAKVAKLEKEAEEAEKELDAKIAAKGEEAKETLETLKSVQSDIRKFIALGKEVTQLMGESIDFDGALKSLTEEIERLVTSALNEEDGDDTAKEEALKKKKEELSDVRKGISAKIDKLSAAKIGKALDGTTEDGEEILGGIKDQWQEAKDQYKEIRDEIKSVDVDVDIDDEKGGKDTKTGEKDEKKAQLQKDIDAKKEELSKAQQDEKPQEDIDKLIDDLNALKQKMSDLGESEQVAHIDEFLKQFQGESNPVKEVSAQPAKAIMTFSDYMSRKSN
jgi:hypothetical protein